MRLSRFTIYGLSALSLSVVAALTAVAPASAQSVQKNATEKSTWHVAPREIQIIDDRPVIRDFREAPAMPQQIQLPPAPQGFGGPGGGGGGNLAGGPGSTLPAGGMPLGSNQGYRTPSEPMGALPKSGFQGTNIPARGMGPKGLLPSGQSTNGLNGKMLNQNKASGAGAGAPGGMSPSSGRSNGDYKGPAAATYSGGYGNGSGAGYGGSASRTDTMVRGSLLRK